MERIVNVQCPYCKFNQNYKASEGFNTLLCYPEEGGCDKYFMISMYFIPVVTTFFVEEAETTELSPF
jgi:hypothetical protein